MKMSCKYCGIVDKPHHCPHGKRKTDNTRVDKKIYKTGRWTNLRQEVLEDHNNICLWSLYVDGRIKAANIVHHIEEVLERDDLAYESSNLISLEYYNHVMIHDLYKQDKVKVQELLRRMISDYKGGDRTLGKYKNYFKL